MTEIAEDLKEIFLPVLKMTQPIGDFFIGSMKAKDLFKIAHFDIRKIRNEGGIDQYLGIQRQLNEKRVAEIQRYVKTMDATFPTAVILAVDERCATVNPIACRGDKPGQSRLFELGLRNVPEPEDGEDPVLFRQIARVIDGQHRIAGLELYEGDFDVNVAIFVGLDIATQASVFSVVNLAQTKVNASLVYDLFSYDEARSPEKTAHELAVALDSTSGSPFEKRIRRLGVATEGRFGETLSQATFVRAVLPYITDDVMTDREIGRRGGSWPSPDYQQMLKMIFRTFFVNNKDVDIAEIMWNYFSAVEERWPEAWAWTGTGRILNKTTGFEALMKFLRPAYRHLTNPGLKPTKAQFAEIFRQVRLKDSDFTTDNFKPGSSGVKALLEKMLLDTGVERA